MKIEVGKMYRMKSNPKYRVKVESVNTVGKTVSFSRAGSMLSKVRSFRDFALKFEECP